MINNANISEIDGKIVVKLNHDMGYCGIISNPLTIKGEIVFFDNVEEAEEQIEKMGLEVVDWE